MPSSPFLFISPLPFRFPFLFSASNFLSLSPDLRIPIRSLPPSLPYLPLSSCPLLPALSYPPSPILKFHPILFLIYPFPSTLRTLSLSPLSIYDPFYFATSSLPLVLSPSFSLPLSSSAPPLLTSFLPGPSSPNFPSTFRSSFRFAYSPSFLDLHPLLPFPHQNRLSFLVALSFNSHSPQFSL